MRSLVRLIVVAATGLALSGCLSFGSLERRGTAVDESVGTLQNRAILINLARASRGEPLYFVSIGNVTGQGTTDLKLANPGFIEGPGMLHSDVLKQFNFGSGSDVLDNTAMTNFQMGVFGTKDFYSGIMSPLGLNDVDLLLHQGFSRELVYYLVIDHAKFIDADAPDDPTASFIVYNDPTMRAAAGSLPSMPQPGYRPTFEAFQLIIQLAMTTGFTTEVPPPAPSGGPSSDKEVVASAQGSGKNTGGIQFVLQQAAEKAPGARLCFEAAMATPDGLNLLRAANERAGEARRRPIFCGVVDSRKGNKQVVLFPCAVGFDAVHNAPKLGACDPSKPAKYYDIQIYTRSIYSIFKYLGVLMNRPEDTPTLVDYDVPGETTPTGLLFKIGAGGAGGCFTAARYAGSRYCVSNGADGENTRQIFNILNALVALKQSPGDLPLSQTVLIAP